MAWVILIKREKSLLRPCFAIITDMLLKWNVKIFKFVKGLTLLVKRRMYLLLNISRLTTLKILSQSPQVSSLRSIIQIRATSQQIHQNQIWHLVEMPFPQNLNRSIAMVRLKRNLDIKLISKLKLKHTFLRSLIIWSARLDCERTSKN